MTTDEGDGGKMQPPLGWCIFNPLPDRILVIAKSAAMMDSH